MAIKIITAAAAYPVTLAEAKEFCRIDSVDSSQDTTLTMLIAAMTNYAEHLTGRAFVERTLELDIDHFSRCIELPWAPLIGIDSVKYLDADEVLQTVDAADYEVDTISQPGKVRPVSGESWPSIGTGFNTVRIRYRAGYAAPGSPQDLTDNTYLPGEMRTWMAARICTLYDQRAHVAIANGSMLQLPRDFADGLLDSLLIGTRFF
jgi:uncharacterized phiE125 gp8 family phage protein